MGDTNLTLTERFQLPWTGRVEAPRLVQIPGYPFEHEVRIALPPSYDRVDAHYPTLWVTDNMLELAQGAVLGTLANYAPELIIVAIGAPRDLTFAEYQRRRTYDFTPSHDEVGPYYQAVFAKPEMIGGAARFRDYLVDELRPQLAQEYRMDPDDHGLAGHSGGGNFALYSFFTRPDGFRRWLISSPGGDIADWRRLEEEYAATHDDLPAHVYLGVGGAELSDLSYTWGGIIVGFTDLVTVTGLLQTRGYPSLKLTSSVIAGQDHFSVWPMTMAEGVRALWAELCTKMSPAETREAVAAQRLEEAP
jgi:predicted alpha/beta superfamily hydrolase